MDVLQIMKDGHEGLRREAVSLGSVTSNAESVPLAALDSLGKCLQLHLTVEGEYLCPEVEDLFPGAQVVVDIIKANHRVIKRVADEVWSCAAGGNLTRDGLGRVEAMLGQLDRHLDSVEKLLMPKLRQFVPTAEREELGQVIQDVIDERSGEELKFGKRSAPKVTRLAKPTPMVTSKAKSSAKSGGKAATKPAAKRKRA